MMRLRFLGAAGEVTGSLLLVEVESGTLVVDCGMFQGRREESRRRNGRLPQEAVEANAAILTHAHIDHSGNLPTLVKSGFSGPIYTTFATADLCRYMLRDSARIQEHDAAYLNQKFSRDASWVPVVPLYDEQDVLDGLASLSKRVPAGERSSCLPSPSAAHKKSSMCSTNYFGQAGCLKSPSSSTRPSPLT
jgi:metallo-beta-lactamase family protein